MRVLLSTKPRHFGFSAPLDSSFHSFVQRYVKAHYVPALGKAFLYVFVPQTKKMFCVDVWFR